MASSPARLAADIGGTFTDIALDVPGQRVTAKVPTTPDAPERGVMAGIAVAVEKAGCTLADIGLILHGTTLATNAIIERKGAVTALITTEGFRDAVEIGQENRFEQYDIHMEKPAPLVPRYLRFGVPERTGARGQVLRPLDESAVHAVVPHLLREGVASVAVGLLHSYANPAHEQRIGAMLQAALPRVRVSLSSEVSPELREYERLSTVCANAYVQPLLAGYLERLGTELERAGFAGQLLMMTSGGGVIGLQAAQRFPIRLVESGPAAGAILASLVALECGLGQVMSFDMGGTTAKLCLIDDAQPQSSRSFEVARAYRFLKGSGLPLRIPVIEMVEIGAGGGSIARVDALKRVAVGPDSAGAVPGPACYGHGGEAPTVTDADLLLGRIDPAAFAGGTLALDTTRAEDAVVRAVGKPLDLGTDLAALAIGEVVDENMAAAARVHAVERGKRLDDRTIVAFGGAAPLHATRLARKLSARKVVVPSGAGVGSAVGMLEAPVAYDVARTLYQRVADLDADLVNRHFEAMRQEAYAVVAASAGGRDLSETRTAYMRYIGQGHEIAVALDAAPLGAGDRQRLQQAFEAEYRRQFGRTIANLPAEVLTWALSLCTPQRVPVPRAPPPPQPEPAPVATRRVLDPESGAWVVSRVYSREHLMPGVRFAGPALIAEDETTTVVPPGFSAAVDAHGYLILETLEDA